MPMEKCHQKMKLPSTLRFSAPGKVILHGEHSVVYGHLAIAGSLNLRTYVKYSQLDVTDARETFAHFKMPNVNLDLTLSSSVIDSLLTLACEDAWDYEHPQNVRFEKLVNGLETFLSQQYFYQSLGGHQQLAIKCCLFLMVAILNRPRKDKLDCIKPFMLCLSSDLPVGAGAGSSASCSVCLAAVFLCLASFMIDSPKEFSLDEETKDLISTWAFLGEKITHGNPSGLDNSICTFGSLMAFRRPNTIIKIPLHSGVRVLLVDSKVSRNTRTLVDKVATLKKNHEVPVTTIMQAMDSICCEAETLFKLLDEAKKSLPAQETAELFNRMEELWSMNHSLLQALGVSHPSLEHIIQVCKEHGLTGKLTGAGGGGFAIALIPFLSEDSETVIGSVKQALVNCGFDVNDVDLGGPGIQMHL